MSIAIITIYAKFLSVQTFFISGITPVAMYSSVIISLFFHNFSYNNTCCSFVHILKSNKRFQNFIDRSEKCFYYWINQYNNSFHSLNVQSFF